MLYHLPSMLWLILSWGAGGLTFVLRLVDHHLPIYASHVAEMIGTNYYTQLFVN
jgi:hypothetical protein